MYDANLVDIYQPIYDRIVKLVAESVADAEEIDSDLTADGSPLWHYTNHTVRLEPLSGRQVRITNGMGSRGTEHVVVPIEPIGPVVAQILRYLDAVPDEN